MKKIVLSLAVIGGLVFTSCKKDTTAQDQVENAVDSIADQTEDTLSDLKEEVVDTVDSLEAKIAEAQAALDKAVTVEEKQAATKQLNEAKAALATLKGEALSTADEVKQEATEAANKAKNAAKTAVKDTEKKVEEVKETVKTGTIKVKEDAIKSAEELKTVKPVGRASQYKAVQ